MSYQRAVSFQLAITILLLQIPGGDVGGEDESDGSERDLGSSPSKAKR